MRRAVYDVMMGYLERTPGVMQDKLPSNGELIQVCVYSPHPLRATTATLLLDARGPIATVEDLLDYKHVTATRIYERAGFGFSRSAV